jgi:two-component system phosphate regulon sensor histidine kinase PhoR
LDYPVVSLWLTVGDTLTLRSLIDTSKTLPQSMLMLTPQQVAKTGQPAQTSGTMEGDATQRVVQSAVAVPLFWEAKMSGVIAIHNTRPGAFQESDRVVLETLAAQIAGALERIRLFESVEQEQRRLKAVLNSAADAILVTDSNGRLQLVNPAGERLFTDVETKLGHSLPPDRGYDDLIGLLEQSIQTANAVQNEIGWPDKRTFSALVTPIEEGGHVAVLHDVSHFKDLDRVKNEFIASATHDLKNPLTSVLGYTQLIEKAGSLTPQQTEFIKRIQLAANHMNELIQNLIELARIDLGIEAKHEKCNLVELVVGIADEFKLQASSKNQTLTIVQTDERPLVKADPLRLRQVLRNLIGNAVKYTPDQGQVTVSTEVEKRIVSIKIKDTGIGIAANDIPFIFDKFYRARSDETKDIEGNGLGLAIVKAIVEQHNGTINVESTIGAGSCFTVTLPF